MTRSPILVLGVGNELMRDEGTGPRIVRAIEEHFEVPDAIELVDAGTLGLGMLHQLRDREFVLIVDAVDGTGHPVGTVVRLSPQDFAPNQILHSLHDVRLVDVLQAAQLIGIDPPTECIGVQIADITPADFSIGLTPDVEAALPRAVAAVRYVLSEHGAALTARSTDGDAFVSDSDMALAQMRERLGKPGA